MLESQEMRLRTGIRGLLCSRSSRVRHFVRGVSSARRNDILGLPRLVEKSRVWPMFFWMLERPYRVGTMRSGGGECGSGPCYFVHDEPQRECCLLPVLQHF